MAGEAAQQFLDKLSSDVALRGQYRTLGATSVHDILDFALSKDYVFTESDLRAALKDYPENMVIDQMCEMLKIPRGKRSAQTG